MIWFTCKQCGKTHGRPESSIGATIFCTCGAGLLVPWESTAAEPADAVANPELPVLQLAPVTFDPPSDKPNPPAPPQGRGRKRGRSQRHDPLYCFNHGDVSKKAACADCGESFCDDCLVEFAGAALCGPCKNYRVKNLQRPMPPSNLAILSMLIALLTGPVTLLILPADRPGFPWWVLPALVPQALAIFLALRAWRETELDPKVSGRGLALTGFMSAIVTSFLILLFTLYAPHQWL